jgi:hypothetical protein
LLGTIVMGLLQVRTVSKLEDRFEFKNIGNTLQSIDTYMYHIL